MLQKRPHDGADKSSSHRSSNSSQRVPGGLSLSDCSAGADSGEDGEEPSLLGRLHQSQTSRKTPKADVAGQQGTSRFVKRSALMSEQSRYDAVGYPKSTRVVQHHDLRRQKSAAAMRSTPPSSSGFAGVAETQSRLKGFEVRVINTHVGKAVVHAPVLAEPALAAGAVGGHLRDDAPVLPPPSAAELRYNAQRALINTTAVLRSAISGKSAARRITRAKSEQMHALYSAPAAGGAQQQKLKQRQQPDSGGFHISMQFSSEEQRRHQHHQTQQKQKQAGGLSVLEQGCASTASMLELWGMETARDRPSAERGSRDNGYGDGADSDADGSEDQALRRRLQQLAGGAKREREATGQSAEAATMCCRGASAVGPDEKSNGQAVEALSDESQQLIASIFGGRLSIGNISERDRRESRAKECIEKAECMSSKLSPQAQAQATPVVQAGEVQAQAGATTERDGTKMRKPSFWSIFRGSNNASQRKEGLGDEKRERSTEVSPVTHPSTVSGRQHFLKKQQSSSSGFGESFGLSKLLNLGESRYGSGISGPAGSNQLISNKALPSVPAAPQAMAVVADSAAAPAGMADTVADAGCNGFGARLSGSFYTPMQEYFEVTNDKVAAGSVGDDTAGDLAKGADSQSAVSPDGSPGLLHSGADIEKAERPAAVGEETRSSPVGGDPDSDDVPLSMKVREEQDPAGGLGIVHSQPARLRLSGAAFGAGGEGAPVVLSSSRLRFSPDAVVARGLGGRGDEGDSIDLDMDMDMDLDMDLEGDAATLALADESSQQACAMGKYLYDVEEFRCLAAGAGAGAGVGGLEPPVPRILQGIAVPGLEEHAEWLGKREVFNGLALQFYIGNYDFGGQRIDESLRRLCSHIFLRGESQVIDRLLVALARRYVACNPDTTLRTVDVAHAVTYSTLLLNTDLHIADIRAGDRMTKSRFVRNTIDTVAQFQGGGEHLLAELELAKRSMESAEAHSSGGGALRSLVGSMASLHAPPYGSAVARTSRDVARLMGARGKRFSFFEPSSAGAAAAAAGPASRAGSEPPHQHPQPPAPTHAAGGTSSASSLRAFDRLRRKVSTSGARSVDGGVELAGGGADLPELAAVLKDVYAGIKARPLGQPQYARLAMRTTRPSSVRSMPQQTGGADGGRLGVARRAGSAVLNGGAAGLNGSAAVLNGSALAPLPRKAGGSPVESAHIRSGVLVRKHLFERTARKAAHRAWRTCYVSVDRGTVAMYKMDARHGAAPDGRELTDTSLQLGSVSLRHTMTHMLPSPGYSRSRPHVFALQLPSGGVYLFQTASEVELRDWVAACNYWAARESKAPYMIGGVFNMEYGWDNTGDFALRFDEREARADRGDAPTLAEQAAEARRVLDERDASKGAAILEWTPPNNTMQRSDLDEAAQLKALLLHIAYLEEELVAHKKVQGSIEERFYPKTTQFHRAFSNWERKAQYILQELIKYQSYADVLQGALKQMHADFRPIPEEDQQHALLLPPPSPAVMGSPDEAIAASSPSSSAHASSSAAANALSASRASLPQPPLSARRTLDLPPLHGQLHPPSKALPIKELLAPASEKARNRASVIVPVSVSSSNTATSAAAAAAEGCHPRPSVSAAPAPEVAPVSPVTMSGSSFSSISSPANISLGPT